MKHVDYCSIESLNRALIGYGVHPDSVADLHGTDGITMDDYRERRKVQREAIAEANRIVQETFARRKPDQP